MSEEFARFIIENDVQTLATDIPSVDKLGNSQIHKLLLENNINIIENLNNTHLLTQNKYKAYFIPMNIQAEASFIRAFVEGYTEKNNEKMREIADKKILLDNLDKIHTTAMGEGRIKRNLNLDIENVEEFCKNKIKNQDSVVYKKGKNYYLEIDNISFTINSSSYTIITAHKIK